MKWLAPTLWIKYRCDRGNQWTATKDGPYGQAHGTPCNFSGCPEGHFAHRLGETANRTEAHDWFLDIRKETLP